MTLTLYHTPRSRSMRPLWLLEEMGISYDLISIRYDADYFASEPYLKINPMGKVPALYDGEQLIIESTVIMAYILNCFGPSPLAATADDPEYATYLQWLHMAESGIGHYLSVFLGQKSGIPRYAVSKEFEAYVAHQAEKAFGMVADQIKDRDLLLQRGFSAADISLGYTLYLASDLCGMSLPQTVQDYLERLRLRPAWQRMIQK